MFGQNSKSIWEEVRPIAEDVLKTCKVDEVLTIHLEKLIPTLDGCVARGLTFTPYANTLETITEVLSSKSYYENAHKNTRQEEVDKLKRLGEQIGVLYKLVLHESKFRQDEEIVEEGRDRLPNMDTDLTKIENMYKPVKNRERI